MKPEKLVRDGMLPRFKREEWRRVYDREELKRLYALKVKEEIEEFIASDYKDIYEMVDLISAVDRLRYFSGFSNLALTKAKAKKEKEKGKFFNLVLTNLNPNNPSNKMYYDPE